VVADAVAGIDPLAVGSTLTGLEVVSRRQLVAVIPDADTATASCGYTVGVGNGTPPPVDGSGEGGSSSEGADATLTAGGPAYTWSGTATTGADEPTGAGDIVGLGEVLVEGNSVVTKVVQVETAGHLHIVLTTDTPSDFDLEVIDAAGREVQSSGNFLDDEVIDVDVAAGTYRVIVRTFVAVEATFTATATLA
jgi:hypothetical protein